MSESPLPTIADASTLLRLEWRNHWLTPAEYARAVGRSINTVYSWHRTGRLRAFSIPHRRDRHGRLWIQNIL